MELLVVLFNGTNTGLIGDIGKEKNIIIDVLGIDNEENFNEGKIIIEFLFF